MNIFRIQPRIFVGAIVAALALTACNDPPAQTGSQPAADQPQTIIGKAVKRATDQAREELAKGNIDLTGDGMAKAEITPAGDLLIDGKAVPLDDAQRKLMLEYRGRIVAIAEAGIGIGLEGADLAGKAVGAAVEGVLTGNTEGIEKKIEAEAEGIKRSAVKLCEKLPALLDAQNRLATALPAFQPYAKMDQQDIDECGKDGDFNVDIPGTHINADIETGADQGSAAAEAEAASAEAAK